MPGTVLGVGDIEVNKIDKVPVYGASVLSCGEAKVREERQCLVSSRNKEASGPGMDEPGELWEMRVEGQMEFRSHEAL